MIGAGRMGRRHIEVVRSLGLELAGICDHSSKALAEVGAEYDIPKDRRFQSAAALLTETHPQCVIIATTASSHCAYSCDAAEAGAPFILCEKPMAVSLAQCDQMIATCRRVGARLAVNHQMRFMDKYTEPKAIVSSEAFGGLSSVTIVAGNVGMAMLGTHHFEMFRYMTDEPPLEVTAWFSPERVPHPRGAEFEDRAGEVRVTTRSGRRLHLEVGADQGHGVAAVYAGRYGRLFVDELAGTMHQTVREAKYRDLPTTQYGAPAIDTVRTIRPSADLLAPSRALLQALLDDGGAPTGEDARQAVAVLVAAHVSDENGHVPIKVDDQLPRDRVFPWA